MSWQEKAVRRAIEVFRMQSAIESTRGFDPFKPMEAALRAALPLIEVTPAMRAEAEALTDFTSVEGCEYDRDQVRNEIKIAVGVALSACSKEQP